MVKLGLSSRLFLLQGPPNDVEPESELTLTEMKNQRLKEKLAEEFAKTRMEPEKEDEGIDWGLGMYQFNIICFKPCVVFGLP